MNTFSAFRFAARTLLHPARPSAHFPCLNPIALHPGLHSRFKKTQARRSRLRVRNRDIPYEEVTLVDDDGVLTKLQLKNLLSTINHATEWVELVSERHGPVVKIVNKKFALKMEKKLREKQREGMRKNIKKEVQLTWVSEQSDLDHKLARVREYLEIGAKVDIVFSTKPKTDPPSVQAMQEKVKNTVESMAEISKEWKPVEWRKSLAAIFLQGIVDPKRKLTQQQMQLVEDEGGAENEEGAEDEEGAPENEAEDPGDSEPAPPMKPPAATPRVPIESAQPGKPKNYVDLTSLGYAPPARKNPLSGMKKEKKYGKRSSDLD